MGLSLKAKEHVLAVWPFRIEGSALRTAKEKRIQLRFCRLPNDAQRSYAALATSHLNEGVSSVGCDTVTQADLSRSRILSFGAPGCWYQAGCKCLIYKSDLSLTPRKPADINQHHWVYTANNSSS